MLRDGQFHVDPQLRFILGDCNGEFAGVRRGTRLNGGTLWFVWIGRIGYSWVTG